MERISMVVQFIRISKVNIMNFSLRRMLSLRHNNCLMMEFSIPNGYLKSMMGIRGRISTVRREVERGYQPWAWIVYVGYHPIRSSMLLKVMRIWWVPLTIRNDWFLLRGPLNPSLLAFLLLDMIVVLTKYKLIHDDCQSTGIMRVAIYESFHISSHHVKIGSKPW